jgi:hypothetical protein
MRESKYDKYVFIICIIVFLYSFFFVKWEYIYDDYGNVEAFKYPTSVIIAPLAGMLFFFLMLFKEELKPVNRKWMYRKIKSFFHQAKAKFREGIEEYREWRGR